MNPQFNIVTTFTGTQQEIVEQMELMREYIMSRTPGELAKIKRTDIIIQQLPDKPKNPEYDSRQRNMFQQDDSCPDAPSIRGEEQPCKSK